MYNKTPQEAYTPHVMTNSILPNHWMKLLQKETTHEYRKELSQQVIDFVQRVNNEVALYHQDKHTIELASICNKVMSGYSNLQLIRIVSVLKLKQIQTDDYFKFIMKKSSENDIETINTFRQKYREDIDTYQRYLQNMGQITLLTLLCSIVLLAGIERYDFHPQIRFSISVIGGCFFAIVFRMCVDKTSKIKRW